MTASPLRLGLIGAGRWGRNYIKTLGAMDGVRLARLASANPASPDLVDAGCIVSADWREVIDADGNLDGVIVATPPATHAEITAAAIGCGLPVLVEKPLTTNLAEAQDLLALARTRDALVKVGHIHLHHPAYRELKALTAARGPVRAIRAIAGNWGPFRQDTPVLWDWGSHDAALCLDLMDKDLMGEAPITAAARRTEARETDGGWGETVEMTLGFENGVEAQARLGNLMETPCRRFEVQFDDGCLVFADDAVEHKLIERQPGRPDRPIPVDATPPLTRLVEDFAAAIRGGSTDRRDLRLGVQVVETLTRCEESLGPLSDDDTIRR